MGLFDLPAPLFGAIDQLLSLALPPVIRLVCWGILAGWLTMMVYRRLSSQDKIQRLKIEQREQQKIIAGFDGEFADLMPEIRLALALGMRQLGLSLGPALLATIPTLFIIIWVAGQFGYQQPATASQVSIGIGPVHDTGAGLDWSRPRLVRETPAGWTLSWPAPDKPIALLQDGEALFELPFESNIPVIHKRQWWNWLMANPAGYLPDDAAIYSVDIDLPEQQILDFGPGWMHGWMFSFFVSFLLSSIGFKLALKID